MMCPPITILCEFVVNFPLLNYAFGRIFHQLSIMFDNLSYLKFSFRCCFR